MIVKIEGMYDWNTDFFPAELTKFLKEEIQGSEKNIKFLECNSLSTIKEITPFGTK